MAKIKRELVTHTFRGARFDDHGVDLDVLPDLLAYKTILVETAKELWRQKNPNRERLPKNFEDSLVIKFYQVLPGSAAIPLIREIETEGPKQLFEPPPDELDEAVNLVADLVHAVSHDRALPEAFPKSLMGLFENYGKTLRPEEWFEQRPVSGPSPVQYTAAARERLTHLAEVPYEDNVEIVGTVTMARVNRPRMAIMMDDGREIETAFEPSDESIIIIALKEHATAKLSVQGRGQFSPDGNVQKITQVDHVTLLPAGEVVFDATAKPIWQVFDEIMSGVPDDKLSKLPSDAAEQHDHYIYGLPKRTT